jgi:alpha-beta hydrolase superfamily lysophospholipase
MPERTVRFTVGSHALFGTLRLPDGEGPFAAALLVPGSGPVDRDSNHPRMPLEVTRHLAESLAAAGVATFRYDKRGIAASKAAGDWRRFGVRDRIDEATEALRSLQSQPETDPSSVFVIGHSEGAVAAGTLGAEDPSLSGIVLLSASASLGSDLLVWQSEQLAGSLPKLIRLLFRLLRTDLTKRVKKNHAKLRTTTADIVRMDGMKTNAKWFREFLDLDPRQDLARITSPVLAVTGTKDLQVDCRDLEQIAAVVPGPVETWAAPDLTHILRRQSGPASLRAYKQELKQPVDAELLARVSRWVGQHSDLTTAHDVTGPSNE